ncbi:FkbM family methyltransferase [Streptomyces sp. NPDC006197]|uniref:FkbM family methyltransferase n=1 Tax=Streptomyces sp. NPDC006197 TaxID=3156685 RepID=UPI0033BDD201
MTLHHRAVLRTPAGRRAAGLAAALGWAAARMPFVEDEIAGLRAFVRPGDVCVDVGAEYGLYTWALAPLVGRTGRVHSVEPLPGPARWLAFAAGALGCGNVSVHRTALGARPGRGHLSLPRRHGLPVHGRAYLDVGARGAGPNSEFRTSRPVRTRVHTLDQLVRTAGMRRVSFVKADVEGAELALLHGAGETLDRFRPTLLLEIEDRHLAKYGADPSDVVRHLRERGYRMRRWRRDHWAAAAEVTPDCRNYLFTVTD